MRSELIRISCLNGLIAGAVLAELEGLKWLY